MEELKGNLKPAPPVETNEAVWKHSKTKLFTSGLKALSAALPGKGKLLDIGCGFGYFPDLAYKDGWSAEGLEIEPTAAAYAIDHYKLKIYPRPISEENISDATYDAVTMWGVIEQLPDPTAELKEIYRILKPGGILYIRSYNFAFHRMLLSLYRVLPLYLIKMKPLILHAYNFTRKSMTKMLSDNGFSNISIRNSTATSGDPYSTGGAAGRHFVEVAKISIFLLSQLLAALTLGRLLLSSSLISVARKPK